MRNPRIEIFQDKRGEWRWHLRATNGRIVCQGESHTSKRDAIRAAKAVVATCAKDPVVVEVAS